MPEWTHFDEKGNARMVDVTEKNPTIRTATAVGSLLVSEEVLSAIKGHEIKKGDVLTVAQVAGIMAVKQTSHLIPMCHPLLTQNCTVNFALEEKPSPRVIARCTVKLEGKTGVEMEALTGVQIALLTIYDMCKAVDKGMEMNGIHLCQKSGGKSGIYIRKAKQEV